MFDLLSSLLETSLPSRVIALEITHLDPQTWRASLHELRLREEADFYLSVRSDKTAMEFLARANEEEGRILCLASCILASALFFIVGCRGSIMG
ncbi:type VI secretion system baseplate subunit TssK [Proteus mirabilis]|uniref:type VI secretion system baseplate subunit TssK n=1 Tax=Proteus mirabilis TaxID=584 RepID=UPI0034E39882